MTSWPDIFAAMRRRDPQGVLIACDWLEEHGLYRIAGRIRSAAENNPNGRHDFDPENHRCLCGLERRQMLYKKTSSPQCPRAADLALCYASAAWAGAMNGRRQMHRSDSDSDDYAEALDELDGYLVQLGVYPDTSQLTEDDKELLQRLDTPQTWKQGSSGLTHRDVFLFADSIERLLELQLITTNPTRTRASIEYAGRDMLRQLMREAQIEAYHARRQRRKRTWKHGAESYLVRDPGNLSDCIDRRAILKSVVT